MTDTDATWMGTITMNSFFIRDANRTTVALVLTCLLSIGVGCDSSAVVTGGASVDARGDGGASDATSARDGSVGDDAEGGDATGEGDAGSDARAGGDADASGRDANDNSDANGQDSGGPDSGDPDSGGPDSGDTGVVPSDATQDGGGTVEPDPWQNIGPGFSAPTDDPCHVLQPTLQGTAGDDNLQGTNGADVIFSGSGDDQIWGNGGNDVICAGGGEDRVFGGIGNDYIDGGFGRDVLDGGAGHDIIHGRSGGDLLRGQWGNDVLFGDLLDDELYGDDGNDVLIGGHGIELMHGGPGDDWLRGDTNRDEFVGGVGNDTVSFMTTTPPGQPLGTFDQVDGVRVDNRTISAGLASGDGYLESLAGVENIIGSAFDDHLAGGAGTVRLVGGYGDDRLDGAAADGGPGADTCGGSACDVAGEPAGRPSGPLVFLATGPIDLGLVVLGSVGWVDDAFVIAIIDGVVQVEAANGAAITPGQGCQAGPSANQVQCLLGGELRYILGYGGGGNDLFWLQGNGFPRDMTATLDGGDGNDKLVGHAGQDILFAGNTGSDEMIGEGGDDALMSIGSDTDPDTLNAGRGNDQLVSNSPCGGHHFVGGPGVDVGGFARVGTSFSTSQERHRQRIHAQIGYRAYQPAFCARNQGTQLANDIEILEGAGGNDELIGNNQANTIWGWGGDDLIRGLDGNDTLEGHRGNDTLYGGSGRDKLRGNRGFNNLYARDGEQDIELSCGSDGRLQSSDSVDPPAAGCR